MRTIKKWRRGLWAVVASAILSFSALVGGAPTPVKAEEAVIQTGAQPLAVDNLSTSVTKTEGEVDVGTAMGVNHYGARYISKDSTIERGVQSGEDANAYAYYNVMKINVGEQKLTDVEAVEVTLFVHTYFYAGFYLVDADGNDMGYVYTTSAPAPTASWEDGTAATILENHHKGVKIAAEGERRKLTVTYALSNMTLNNVKAGGCSNTANGKGFSWDRITHVKFTVCAVKHSGIFDVLDVKTVKGSEKISIFDGEKAVAKDSLAECTQANDFSAGLPEYGFSAWKSNSLVRAVRPGDVQKYTYKIGHSYTDDTVSLQTLITGKSATDVVDLSAYDALSFEVDATELSADSSGDPFTVKFKCGGRIFQTFDGKKNAEGAYGNNVIYLLDEKDPEYGYVRTETDAYRLKPALKARVILPFTAFRAASGENALTEENLQSAAPYVWITQRLGQDACINLRNIEYIADYQKVVEAHAAVQAFAASFTMIEGASARSVEPCGIRFGVEASATAYRDFINASGVEGVSFGSIILPVDLLGEAGYELDPSNESLAVIPCQKGMTVGEEKMSYNAALVNLYTGNYTRAFTARFYCRYSFQGVEYTLWANMPLDEGCYARSIYEVAKGVENKSAYLLGIIQTVENSAKEA